MTHQYYPLPQEYLATGVIGILFYCIVLYFASLSGLLGFRSKSTQRFFAAVAIMSILELPRFFLLAINHSYNSKIAYSIHTIAGIFFFLAYSIVCRQWSGLLQLGSYFRFVYGYHSLVVANVIFAIIDILTVAICLLSDSLESFFESTAYEIITFFEGIRNCIYSVFLAYYGVKLIRRFWHFSKLEKQQAMIRQRIQLTTPSHIHTNSSASQSESSIWDQLYSSWCGTCWQGFAIIPHDDHIFHGVVFRLTTVLLLSTLCFMVRVIMLILKMIALHSHTIHLTTHTFTLFGFLWFTCSDFLPRTLPTLAFVFLMRTKKPNMHNNGGGKHGEQGKGSVVRSKNSLDPLGTQMMTTAGDTSSGTTPKHHHNHHHHEIAAFEFVKQSETEEEDYVNMTIKTPFTLTSYEEEEEEYRFGYDREGRGDDMKVSILEHGQFIDDSHHGLMLQHPQEPTGQSGAQTGNGGFFSFSHLMGRSTTGASSSSPSRMQMSVLSPHSPRTNTTYSQYSYHPESVHSDDDSDEEEDEDEDELGPGESALNKVFSFLSSEKESNKRSTGRSFSLF